MTKNNRKAQFITRAREIHGDTYDLSCVDYINNKLKISLECSIHGKFLIRPNDLIDKQRGCPECGKLRGVEKHTSSKEQFIEKAIVIHGSKYDYSKVNYINALTKIEIIDKDGDSFFQTPANHLSGHCSVKERNNKFRTEYVWDTNRFIFEARKLHKNKYDYSKVNYIRAHDKITIICREHGEFDQQPYLHLAMQGCPKCSNSVSSDHLQIINFIEELGIEVIVNDRKILSGFELDIWIPTHNLAIEYCGLYWHSKRNELDHVTKHNKCDELGIRLLTIFSDEFKFKKEILFSKIKQILVPSILNNADIHSIDHETTETFIIKNSFLPDYNFDQSFGIFENNELMSVLTYNKNKINFCSNKQYNNLFSILFSNTCRNDLYYDMIIDRRLFSGISLIDNDFKIIGILPHDFYYTDHYKRYDNLEEIPNLSKVWDCGKIHFRRNPR